MLKFIIGTILGAGCLLLILMIIAIIRTLRQNKQEQLKSIEELESLYFQLFFLEGNDYDKQSPLIQQIFENVNLLISIQVNPNKNDKSTTKIFDTSLYLKNRTIGLTYFVQEQTAEEIIASDSLKQLAQEAQISVADALSNSITLTAGCTVIQMKDGTWLWRQEE